MRIYAEVDRWPDCYSPVSNLENRLPFTTSFTPTEQKSGYIFNRKAPCLVI